MSPQIECMANLAADEIVIRIGIDYIAYTSVTCKAMRWDDGTPLTSVADKTELLRDVVHWLNREQEDGTTLLHEALDKAIVEAYEFGSEGFSYDESET